MKTKMFTVYDSKAQAYMMPFFMNSRGEALRAWQDLCNDEKTQFGKHPEDFTLFEIGEYDQETGKITQTTAFISLGTALEFKKQKNLGPNV